MQDKVTRRLAAIIAVDLAGYSRLMGADDSGRPGSFVDGLSKAGLTE